MANTSLRTRFATGLILIALATALILALPTPLLAVLFGAVVLLGASEWAALIEMNRAVYVPLVGGGLAAGWLLVQDTGTTIGLLIVAVAVWMVGLFLVWRYPALPPWWRIRSVQALAGFLILVPAWAALVVLHSGRLLPEGSDGHHYTLFLMTLVWVADSAAFFAGRRFGKRRLAPHVSPAKTIEGLLGAVFATVLAALVGVWWLSIGMERGGMFVVLCVLTLLSSVLGDLMESVLKRTQGAKDSGTLLPGHGGVLDRIDSLTAASPVFVLGLVVLWSWTP